MKPVKSLIGKGIVPMEQVIEAFLLLKELL
ncbi:hypothetical protein SDC9_200056 [bioreactor metagenome]|uniref:Uncharacterized protein n=1 Tax=bioreactor metagenome TaxID=1076179 RepID=A0A645IM48_9ZZZZ